MRMVGTGFGVIGLVLSAHLLVAQQPGQARPRGGHQGMMSDSGMAQQHMRAMDSLNAHMDTLVTRMNMATGDQKVTAMADVINALIAERRMMHEHMQRMMGGHGMKGHRTNRSGRGKGQPPAGAADSGAADSAHTGHHPSR